MVWAVIIPATVHPDHVSLLLNFAIVIGAALPELMAALVSIMKGQREISVGILVGSNITNPLFSMGLGAAISGCSVPAVTVLFDLPVKIATGLLIYFFLAPRRPAVARGAAADAGYPIGRGLWFPVDMPA